VNAGAGMRGIEGEPRLYLVFDFDVGVTVQSVLAIGGAGQNGSGRLRGEHKALFESKALELEERTMTSSREHALDTSVGVGTRRWLCNDMINMTLK
jgi:hypothetical protein